jgi:predicted acyltransferase
MILGLIAGGILRDADRTSAGRVRWLLGVGALGLLAGWGLGALGVCPVVKRIWTPTWVLFSGGWCCLLLGAFYTVIDVAGLRAWAFPLIVIGMNSIAAYVLAHLIEGFIVSSLKTHLGPEIFKTYAPGYAPLLQGGAVLLVLWLILLWMYRRKIFLRI